MIKSSFIAILTFLMLLQSVPSVMAQTDRIVINGISIFDITKSPISKTSDGSTLIADEEGFQIVYFPQFEDEFLIDVTASPFEEHRQKAERFFLDMLQISKSDACFLYTVISTSSQVNPQEGGNNYELSFCESASRADINKDGVVNTIDYALVIKKYGTETTEDVDVNGDGVVNAGDLSVIINLLGKQTN